MNTKNTIAPDEQSSYLHFGILRYKGIRHNERFVLAFIYWDWLSKGSCTMSLSEICDIVPVTERTAHLYIRRLTDGGYCDSSYDAKSKSYSLSIGQRTRDIVEAFVPITD